MATKRASFPPGIHAPSFTFFTTDARQEIDWHTQDAHLSYLIKSGLQGIVVAGTCGEAAALTLDETSRLVSRARELASEHGKDKLPITVGCLGHCTRDVIDRTHALHKSGADFALVLVPAAFAFIIDQRAVVDYFTEVADHSPMPVVIYNFPGVVNGLDVSSDTLATLSRHENICAVKLTCGNIAKVATTAARSAPESFTALAGQADWLLPALSVGGGGCIAGVANLFPRALVQIRQLYQDGDMAAAAELQKKVSLTEIGFAKAGLNGSKWIIAKTRQYPDDSAHCRRPIPRFTDPEKMDIIVKYVSETLPVEKELEVRGTTSN
ncbi:dihydrodipicolinate synthetase [Xylariaceae sp. FL0662B]|nr:dihydrodipicolinate synthetase [Xylariaceae sp. FL0662B]